ncbi:uncharacterized protein LOC132922251 [Rhopalosiphum padi]|uniref:uncharacterized protein LOC132922251 n=1 Tax=Rhopalosiphum padi TaxID=40932 RepID=UPI00298E4E6E|nr:uncharacterized protein LOC132922251 [Rhopalosiphum padi]
MAMNKTVFLAIIIGVIVCSTQASNTKESKCKEDIEEELREYVKLDGWQKLFTRHFKFIVNENGEVLSERKRLKFNTIIHNAIYGCNHERDDEVDDCPNIYHGSIRTCKHGQNIRSAMFRAARCNFVESSVKHIILSDALLNTYPLNKYDKISANVDKPIREFGENVVNMLSILSHGETEGLGELMALNLYLNNVYDTVFIQKIPIEPVMSSVDLEIAKEHIRKVHSMILDKLYTFWDTWCSDKDIVTQFRLKYKNDEYIVILDEMNKNIEETDDFIHSLNVSDNVVDLDFDPERIALTGFVNHLISNTPMPNEFLVDLKLKSFEATYEFNPHAMYAYHKSVFKAIYICFYWTTITHLKLGIQFIDEIENYEVTKYQTSFIINFVKYIRPLAVFNINRSQFALQLSTEASKNLNSLISFLLKYFGDLSNTNLKEVILLSRLEIQKIVNLLSADMESMLNMKAPDNYYYDAISYENVLKLMRSNYRAFNRLVLATSGFKEDRMNVIKLKKCFFYLSEAIEFDSDSYL